MSAKTSFFKHSKAEAERIYIVFHWAGLIYTLTVILIIVSGYFKVGVGGAPQTLGVVLLVAGLVAMIQTNENMRGINVESVEADPYPEKSTGNLLVIVSNSSRIARHNVRIKLRYKKAIWLTIPSLLPGEQKDVLIASPTLGRGRHKLPALMVSSVFPCGLFYSWKVFIIKEDLLVYPEPRGFAIEREHSGGIARDGEKAEAGGEDISDHRPYVKGDNLAHVDWRVYARIGQLLVRTLEGAELRDVILDWRDTSAIENREDRLKQLSFWIDECLQHGWNFRLILASYSTSDVRAARTALAEADLGSLPL